LAKKNRDKNQRVHAPVRSSKGGASITPGNHPRNSGGKAGRSGRKPLPVRLFCAEVLADERVRAGIRATARNPEAPGYAAIVKLLVAYAEGLPTATHRVETKISPMREYEISEREFWIPDNGRSIRPTDDDDPPPPRASRPAARAQVPPNGNRGGYPPGYLWPDGSWRVIPPE
jgi:hypothetical protein